MKTSNNYDERFNKAVIKLLKKIPKPKITEYEMELVAEKKKILELIKNIKSVLNK